jgi:hypothetical protein
MPSVRANWKAAIAYLIGICESPNLTQAPADPSDHWYRYLWNQMADSCSEDEFERNGLRVVTFNYDRSLERYLVDRVMHCFGKSEEESRKKLEGIPIIHVYGQLGHLWPADGQRGRPYDNSMSPEMVEIAAAGIHIIEDRRNDDPILDDVNRLIADADRVCFLGFSFDPTNVRRLRLECIGQRQRSGFNVQVYGTTLGLEAAERVTQLPSATVTPAALFLV